MTDRSERDERIRIIEALPGELVRLVAGLTDQQLDARYREGGWTVRQVVHHLADAHMNGYVRTRLVVTEDHPIIKGYDQDRWAALVDARTFPIETSLQILRGLHARWAALLRSLGDEAWARTGRHTERGEMSLDRMLEIYARHCTTHLDHVRAGIALRP